MADWKECVCIVIDLFGEIYQHGQPPVTNAGCTLLPCPIPVKDFEQVSSINTGEILLERGGGRWGITHRRKYNEWYRKGHVHAAFMHFSKLAQLSGNQIGIADSALALQSSST